MKKLKTKLIYTRNTPRGNGKTFSTIILCIKSYLKKELGFKWYFLSKKQKDKLIANAYNSLTGA